MGGHSILHTGLLATWEVILYSTSNSTSQLLGGHSLLYYTVDFLEVFLYHAAAIPTNVHLEGHSKYSINAILPSLSTVYFGSSVNIISLLLYRFTTLGEGHSVLLFCQLWVKLGVTLYSILANAMVGGGHLDCARSDCYA